MFLSNRATAAHLALAAVAPLVLCGFFPDCTVWSVVLWLTLVAVLWSLMQPVKQPGEHTIAASRRLLGNTLADPFFWVSVVVAVYVAVIALNSGVGMAYDVETKVWRLASPSAPLLPGAVAGVGFGHFAGALLILVLYPGVAHALDDRQGVYFAMVAVAAVAIEIVYALAAGVGVSGASAAAYGFWSLTAAAALLSAEYSRSRTQEMFASLLLVICLMALLLAARPLVAIVFVAAILLLTLAFAGFGFREIGFSGVFRALLLILVSMLVAAALFNWLSGDWEKLLPVFRTESDRVLVRIGFESWQANRWTGSGVGSLPLVTKLAATSEDWSVLGAVPDFSRCGWLALLVERGVVGLVLAAAALGSLFFSWVRSVRRRGLEDFAAAVPLLPIAIIAVAAVLVLDGSALAVEAVVAFVALAAFSVNGGK